MEPVVLETIAPTRAWAFTCKMLGAAKDATVEAYTPVIAHYAKYGLLQTYEFEEDPKGKLHVHGIILLKRKFFRKRLEYYGFHMHLEEIYDEKGWKDYILKKYCHKVDNKTYMFD